MSESVSVLAVADSDSYLKWSLATLRQMPADWITDQVVIDSPLRPSPAQTQAAGGDHGVAVLSRGAVLRRIGRERPDVVLLACTGPVIAALTGAWELRRTRRPVLLTGLPGISFPVRPGAITQRAGCDLMLLHSHREIAAFTAAAGELGADLGFGLATLPFLGRPVARTGGLTTLFAAQAEIPARPGDRKAILRALAEAPRPVVKVRAGAGEAQTHHETWDYRSLAAGLGLDGLTFRGGSLTDALGDAAGLVTVSSTSALEAVGADVPILILTDFGLDDATVNVVFADSGCLGTLDDLRAARFLVPDPDWRTQNYFHDPADDDWLGRLSFLLSRRRAGALPVRSRRFRPLRTAVRRRIRLLPPVAAAARWSRRRRERTAPDRTAPAPLRAHRPG